jgi:hypothetical protein
MRIDHVLYFAPGIRFDQIDLGVSDCLNSSAREWRDSTFSRQSYALTRCRLTAGVLVLACIDALARIQIGGGVGQRFRQFAAREISSFTSGDKATRLYDDFRNCLDS